MTVSPGTTTTVVVVTPHCCYVTTKDLHFIQQALMVAQVTYMNAITIGHSEAPFDLTLQKEIDLVQHMTIQGKTLRYHLRLILQKVKLLSVGTKGVSHKSPLKF